MKVTAEKCILTNMKEMKIKLQDRGDKKRDRLVVSNENRDMYLKRKGRKRNEKSVVVVYL